MADSPYNWTEVTVVGAGPIGIELAAALKQSGIPYRHLEAGPVGQTFTWWPHNTTFFSTPERIAIAGVPIQTVQQQNLTGEAYLVYLRQVIQYYQLKIQLYEPVEQLEPVPGGFRLRTRSHGGEQVYYSRKVVLATGGMAGPNRLDIPGEDLPHVSHYFRDPHDYFQQRLLVVGGRNSAIEAALRCWRAGAEVALSYRRPDIQRERVKPALRDDFDTVVREGRMTFLPATAPVEITPRHAVLAQVQDGQVDAGRLTHYPADFVLLMTGYTADMRLFAQAGVQLVGAGQAPQHDPASMETNVPGLYVAGTAAGGTQKQFTIFIETAHADVARIMTALCGQQWQGSYFAGGANRPKPNPYE
ncbi:MAG: NAD(P)-binding domain-containing protein [Chloroflexi bacterium]|nr:NAD(P)-binding domain-containing protein [Chloroflexota bacterium]